MPLLLKLAAQSEAMRSLQSAEGEDLSESAASVLRGEMAEGLRELADLVDAESAEIIRLRAKGLAGGIEHREMTLEIARSGPPPALEIVCGPLCTWRMKTRIGLHSFLAAARDEAPAGAARPARRLARRRPARRSKPKSARRAWASRSSCR